MKKHLEIVRYFVLAVLAVSLLLYFGGAAIAKDSKAGSGKGHIIAKNTSDDDAKEAKSSKTESSESTNKSSSSSSSSKSSDSSSKSSGSSYRQPSDSSSGKSSGHSSSNSNGRNEKSSSNNSSSNSGTSVRSESKSSSQNNEKHTVRTENKSGNDSGKSSYSNGSSGQSSTNSKSSSTNSKSSASSSKSGHTITSGKTESDTRNAQDQRVYEAKSTKNWGRQGDTTVRRYDSNETRSHYDNNRHRYELVGDSWRERNEHRKDLTEWQKHDSRSRWFFDPFFHSFIHRPIHYSHYSYVYEYRHTYPSIYCLYYNYLPPYISGVRIYYEPRPFFVFTVIDIPLYTTNYTGYYLDNRYDQQLTYTLRDIRRAWEANASALLLDHVRYGYRISVYLDGDYAYSIDPVDYAEMTRDAMDLLRTRNFEFYRVVQRSTGEVVAYGRHIYLDEDSREHDVYVSYTLERYGRDWYISEVGSSENRL